MYPSDVLPHLVASFERSVLATVARMTSLTHRWRDAGTFGALSVVHERKRLTVRILEAIAQLLCGLRGHEMLYRFAPGRMWFQCLSCGAETPGWSFDVDPRFRTARHGAGRVLTFTAPIQRPEVPPVRRDKVA